MRQHHEARLKEIFEMKTFPLSNTSADTSLYHPTLYKYYIVFIENQLRLSWWEDYGAFFFFL